MACPQENFEITGSITLENTPLHRKHVYSIVLHLEVENMTLLSNLYCTNLKKLKTLIFKV